MTAPLSTQGHDFEPLSHAVIGTCIDVQRQLGVHCMEVDYQRALALRKRGLYFQREVKIPIRYDGVVVARRRVDLVIWNETHELILETKARADRYYELGLWSQNCARPRPIISPKRHLSCAGQDRSGR